MKLFDVYPLFDIEPVKASGSYLWDRQDVRYLDLYGGHAVISIGHSHPHYLQRIGEQLNKIGFYSNSVKIPLQQQLADKLGQLSGYTDYSLFLSNSGAEANENALKLASFHTGRRKIIAFDKSFHGRTSLAVAVTDDPSIAAPVNENALVTFVPLQDEKALENAMNHEVCAVIIEGIQGVGGVRMPSAAFLKKVRALCNQYGALLILDEVQSGYGRSGKFFAHQYADILPDIITVAKGMGNGFPVAGTLIHPDIMPRQGMLGTTFGGNHLACAAALAVLEVIENENLIAHAAAMGEYLMQALQSFRQVKDVRGRGLMIGIELQQPCAQVRKELLFTHKIFTGGSSDKHTIRILPALNISRSELDIFLSALDKVLKSQTAAVS